MSTVHSTTHNHASSKLAQRVWKPFSYRILTADSLSTIIPYTQTSQVYLHCIYLHCAVMAGVFSKSYPKSDKCQRSFRKKTLKTKVFKDRTSVSRGKCVHNKLLSQSKAKGMQAS